MRTLETSRLILRDWTADDIGCEVFDISTIQYLLGIRLLETYRNKGLMSEALECVIQNASEITDALSYLCLTDDKRSHLCYNVGDEFIFYRNDEKDDYWHCGEGTLVKSGKPDEGCLRSPGIAHCGTKGVLFCSEAWDALADRFQFRESRYDTISWKQHRKY